MSITRTTNTASNGTREAVLAALASDAAMTSAQVADTAGIGRSAAARSLASLAADGLVTRTAGGREGTRRLSAAPTATTRRPRTAKRTTKSVAAANASSEATGVGRLRSGELAGQVLGYLREHPGQHSPTAIAAGLGGRSGGAVSNALARLTDRGEVALTQDRPRRYAALNA
jgi:DNA-binding transcriptional ArsR family regulator